MEIKVGDTITNPNWIDGVRFAVLYIGKEKYFGLNINPDGSSYEATHSINLSWLPYEEPKKKVRVKVLLKDLPIQILGPRGLVYKVIKTNDEFSEYIEVEGELVE